MSATSYQSTRIDQLDVDALFNQIIYNPKLIGLGHAQGEWNPVAYANAQRDILKVSFDEMQKQPNSIADNIFRRIGLRTTSEKIQIQPLVLEFVESGFQQRNAQDIVPVVLTELNIIFDNLNAKKIAKIAKKGTDITWSCSPSFVNTMLTNIAKLPRDVVKVLLMPSKVDIALNSICNFAETRHWYEELINCANRLNAEVVTSSAIGDKVYLIQKPLLAEYQGLFPCVHKDGVDDRTNEYWMQFILSGSDFIARVENAIEYFEVKSLDLDNLSKTTCPTGQ